MQLASDGTFSPLEGTKAARDSITNCAFLIRCLNTWWDIRSFRFLLDCGAGPSLELSHGWLTVITRLSTWYGTGSLANYSFDGIRKYAIALMYQGLDDFNFNFGDLHQDLVSEYVFSKTNLQSRQSLGHSLPASVSASLSSSLPLACNNWNIGRPCHRTPCTFPHVCRTCHVSHRLTEHNNPGSNSVPKRP
jgi:hypothetical protein